MIKKETIHQLLALADVKRDPYAVADACAALLDDNPTDTHALGGYIRVLVALGLGMLARRLWANISQEPLGPVPAGVIAWRSRQRRFAANCAALAQRWPQAAELIGAWNPATTPYELHQAMDGNYHILNQTQNYFWQAWLGSLADHQRDAAAYNYDKRTTPMPGAVGFDGVGYGGLLTKVLESTQQSYLDYSCAVYIVEPDPAALAMLLHLHDLRAWLSHPRLRVYTGPGALEDFTAALRDHRAWAVPTQYISNRLTCRPEGNLESTCRGFDQQRRAHREAVLESIRQIYEPRTAAWWHQRYAAALAGHTPLRVLGITTRFSTVLQYSMVELGQAITAAGHEFKLTMEADNHTLERPDLDVIAEYQPDLMVQISRMRHETPWLPRQIPDLCWDQDNLPSMRTAAATQSLDALTYVAGHGAEHGFLNLGWPERNCIFFKAAGSTHRYSNAPVPPELHARLACDFSYVSNASGTPEAEFAEQLAVWKGKPDCQRLLAATGEQVLAQSRSGYAWDSARLADCLRAQAAQLQIPLPDAACAEMVHQLYRVSDRAFRHVALEWVVAYCREHGRTFRLFGRGWQGHPVLGSYAQDFIAPGEELRALYQATKINLQIIESGFVHSRVLDGLAAGGFFLSRFAPEARDHNGTGRLVHAMAVQALAAGLRTNGDLQDSTDPIIAPGWAVMAANMKPEDLRREQPCRYLRQWAACPTEEVAFPQLNDITFTDQDSFATLATRYLHDDAARVRRAEALRCVVVEQFSYDAFWRESLATMCRGFQDAAGSGA